MVLSPGLLVTSSLVGSISMVGVGAALLVRGLVVLGLAAQTHVVGAVDGSVGLGLGLLLGGREEGGEVGDESVDGSEVLVSVTGL
jgi:hypothetical protein